MIGRPHAQGVAQQVPLLDLALAVDVGRPRFQAHNVRLLQPQLCGVFNRNDTLTLRDVG
jgi:hypothetical protein